eukprot:SAG11_NODE_335_length_10564_cov_23.976015_8_plen_43_part_00
MALRGGSEDWQPNVCTGKIELASGIFMRARLLEKSARGSDFR